MPLIVDRAIRTTLALASAGVLSVSLSACDQWSATCDVVGDDVVELTSRRG